MVQCILTEVGFGRSTDIDINCDNSVVPYFFHSTITTLYTSVECVVLTDNDDDE